MMPVDSEYPEFLRIILNGMPGRSYYILGLVYSPIYWAPFFCVEAVNFIVVLRELRGCCSSMRPALFKNIIQDNLVYFLV